MKEIFEKYVKYVDLRIVPSSLTNIIFVTFHDNPIDRHLNLHRTYHQICQRYFYAGM